ncbi:response regulator [Vibrio sp. PP-XX7]
MGSLSPEHPPLLIELYPLLDGYPTKYASDKGDAAKDLVGRTESTSYTLIKYLHKPVVMSELLSVCLNAQDPNLQWLMYAQVRGEFLTLSDDLLQRFSQTAVLIVDDNRINREVTATILESVGIQCLLANNGQEAIDILFESGIRVGYDFYGPPYADYRWIYLYDFNSVMASAGEKYQNIPIIVYFTADAVPGERDQCLRVGMSDYLSKPVTAEDLTDKASAVCVRCPVSFPEYVT